MSATDTLTSEQVIALAKKHLIGNYTRYPVCLVRLGAAVAEERQAAELGAVTERLRE